MDLEKLKRSTQIALFNGKRGKRMETVLYDNIDLTTVAAVNTIIDLEEEYTKFDEIRVEYGYIFTQAAGNNKIFPIINTYTSDELETMRTALYDGRKGYILFLSLNGMYVALDITSTSQLTAIDVKSNASYNQYITKITGIKY